MEANEWFEKQGINVPSGILEYQLEWIYTSRWDKDRIVQFFTEFQETKPYMK